MGYKRNIQNNFILTINCSLQQSDNNSGDAFMVRIFPHTIVVISYVLTFT